MTKKEWALVTAVVGVGILAQIPSKMASDGQNAGAVDQRAMTPEAMAAAATAAVPGTEAVQLDVTGMT